MQDKYKPTTEKEKVQYLMATDERREDHIKALQGDIKALGENVNSLIDVIVGNKFNKKNGFVELHNALDEKVKLALKDITDLKDFQSTIQPQFNIGKWVFLAVTLIFLGAVVSDIRGDKPKYKTEIKP